MAKALPLQTMDSLAGVDARLQAIDKLEELVNEVVQEKRRRRSNIALKRAIRTWRKGDIVKAGQWALKATEADPENSKAFHVLAMALERMGHLHKALVTYERAFQLDPEDPELLINLGLTAWNLKLTEGAARMFQLYIAACPESPLGYNNLGSIQSDMGTPDVAIETLRAALYRMPNEAILWNSLATVLAEEGRADESLIFYREAARLEPGFARAYHNLGYAYQHLSELDNALASYDKALELVVDPAERIETRHSRSICLIGLGKLEEGFREYEIRNNERFRCYFHHIIDAPRWHGEDVRGKKLLLVGEQGLGDEIMFSNILPDAQAAVGDTGKLGAAPGAVRLQGKQAGFLGADGIGPAILPQIGGGLSPQTHSGARYRPGGGVQEANGDASRQEGRHLLALHVDERKARQILLPHRRLGQDFANAGHHLRQPAVWRQRSRHRPRRGKIRRAHPPGGRPGPEGRYRRHGGAGPRPGPGAFGAHCRCPYRRQRRRESLVPGRWPGLAAVGNGGISLACRHPRLLADQVRRLGCGDAAFLQRADGLRGRIA